MCSSPEVCPWSGAIKGLNFPKGRFGSRSKRDNSVNNASQSREAPHICLVGEPWRCLSDSSKNLGNPKIIRNARRPKETVTSITKSNALAVGMVLWDRVFNGMN
jgi:hypothetical protein